MTFDVEVQVASHSRWLCCSTSVSILCKVELLFELFPFFCVPKGYTFRHVVPRRRRLFQQGTPQAFELLVLVVDMLQLSIER